MQESMVKAAMLEALIVQAIKDAGFDPEPARAEIAAIAAKLAGSSWEGDPTAIPYAELVEMAAEVPNFVAREGGGAYVVIGTVNIDGKHYRVWKAWATIDGQVIWQHPAVVELKTWHGASIKEIGHEYVPGSEGWRKRYVTVFWVPPGREVVITECWEDAFKGRRSLRTRRYST